MMETVPNASEIAGSIPIVPEMVSVFTDIAPPVPVVDPITHPCCQKGVSLQRDLDSANRRVAELESENASLTKQVEDLSRIHGVDTAYLNQT